MPNHRKNYCGLPFHHTAIESNGDVKACCLTPPFVNNEGANFNLNRHTLAEVYGSQDFKNFLRSFQEDERHPYCQQCWYDDDTGTLSNRMKFTTWMKNRLGIAPGSLDRNLNFLEIKVGNACNLMCRICGPHNSSRAALEDFNITGATYGPEINRLSRWVSIEKIWDDLATLDVKAIHIMGGEPLIDKTHLRLLERLVADGKSSDIILWYNTNGTVYPDKFLDIWSNFKLVQISVSVDDFGPRYEYQRFPGKWPEVEANLVKLYQLNQNPKILTGISICWSLFNIYYVDEIIDYYLGFFKRNDLIFRDEIARSVHYYTGDYYCPKTLRPEERRFFSDKLSESRYREDSHYSALIARLHGHLQHDNYSSKTEVLRVNKIKAQDRYRKQNFSIVFPELSFLVKDDLIPASP